MKKECFWHNPGYKANKALIGRHTTSYLIIGGGIAGLFTAHYLLKRGVKNITLIEKDTIGSGSTGYSAGMLESEIEIPVDMLIRRHGTRLAARYKHAQKAAQLEVKRLIQKEKIRCDFEERPLYFFKQGSSRGVFIEKSISVNPLKLAHGMRAYLKRRGVRIFEYTALKKVRGNVAHTENGFISFKRIIYALGTFQKHPAIVNYMTTICVTRPLSSKKLREVRRAHKEMFFDDERQSYHYGKITRDKRLLIGYGDVLRASSGVVTSLHMPHVRSIQRFLKREFGENFPIHRAWSAAYALSLKTLPYVSVEKGVVGGAGTQIASIAATSYLVSALLREKHPLARVFKHS